VNRRDGFMKAAVVAAVVTAALSFSAAAAEAGVQTTVPSRFVEMLVVIKDTGIIVAYAGGSRSHDNAYPLYGPIPRGDTLTIGHPKHRQEGPQLRLRRFERRRRSSRASPRT